MIVFDFCELGLDNLTQYNGQTVQAVNSDVINRAADYFKTQFDCQMELDEDIFLDYNWGVDLVQRTITIPDNSIVPGIVEYH